MDHGGAVRLFPQGVHDVAGVDEGGLSREPLWRVAARGAVGHFAVGDVVAHGIVTANLTKGGRDDAYRCLAAWPLDGSASGSFVEPRPGGLAA